MKLGLTFDDATRFKQQYMLDELSAYTNSMNNVEEIVVDLEDIYMGVTAMIRATNVLLKDRQVGVNFKCSDIYKLRAMQAGLREMITEFAFNLEMRAAK